MRLTNWVSQFHSRLRQAGSNLPSSRRQHYRRSVDRPAATEIGKLELRDAVYQNGDE